MALSDGAVITMCNSSAATMRSTTTSSSTSIDDGSCNICPVQLSHESKTKQDNVCQLMTTADRETLNESRVPYQ